MSRRTTIDAWEIEVNYGGGWEYETTEYSRKDCRAQLLAYSRNCPYPCRIKRRRLRIADCDPAELRDARAAGQVIAV